MQRRGAETGKSGGKVKISVTVDRDVWEEAKALPWASSGSEVVNEALHRLVGSERLGAMLDELYELYGPPDEEQVAKAQIEVAKWLSE
jgi:hypothetical protein